MTKPLLLDTDVIIDYLRGRRQAIDFIESLDEPPSVSAIVVAELYAGVRDGEERNRLEGLLNVTSIIPVDRRTAIEGGLLRRQYGKSHSTGLDDALIAATVDEAGGTLATLNDKHFPMLKNLLVPYRK